MSSRSDDKKCKANFYLVCYVAAQDIFFPLNPITWPFQSGQGNRSSFVFQTLGSESGIPAGSPGAAGGRAAGRRRAPWATSGRASVARQRRCSHALTHLQGPGRPDPASRGGGGAAVPSREAREGPGHLQGSLG